jgi:hypothetical protein
MSRVHELKSDPLQFEQVVLGNKKAEVRVNDRDYQKGDTMVLRETAHSAYDMLFNSMPLEYTGRSYEAKILHTAEGYGLKDGHVCLSFCGGGVLKFDEDLVGRHFLKSGKYMTDQPVFCHICHMNLVAVPMKIGVVSCATCNMEFNIDEQGKQVQVP